MMRKPYRMILAASLILIATSAVPQPVAVAATASARIEKAARIRVRDHVVESDAAYQQRRDRNGRDWIEFS